MPTLPPLQRLWPPMLVAALVIGFGLRLYGILVLKTDPTHDEAITLLSTAGGQGGFANALPGLLDHPLPAAEVRNHLDTPGQVDPGTVSRDLAAHDIHPPLYFHLVHLLRVATGMDLRAMLLLNVLLGLLYLPLLSAVMNRLGGDGLQALFAIALWYLSPAVLDTDLEARPYTLLGLLALASWLLGHDLLHRTTTWWRAIAFLAVNVAGLLTHYYFGLLVLPFVWQAWRHRDAGNRRLAILQPLLAGLLFLMLYPAFLHFLVRFPPPAIAEPSRIGIGTRSLYALVVPMGFFSAWPLLRYACLALIVALPLLAKWSWPQGWWRRTTLPAATGMGHLRASLGWSIGFTTALYIAGVPPAQAVGGPYFAYIWPLVAVLVVRIIHMHLTTAHGRTLLAVMMVQGMLSNAHVLRHTTNLEPFLPPQWRLPEGAVMLTDDPRRGHLCRLALRLAPTDTLLIAVNTAPGPLVEGREVHVLRRAGTEAQGGAIAEWLAMRHAQVIATTSTHHLLRVIPGEPSAR